MKKRLLITVIILFLSVSGCTFDMNVPNNNEPDSDRVLATPADVEGLIAGAFREYWFTVNGHYPGEGLSVLGDEKVSMWKKWGMLDFQLEPRRMWNNSATYSHAAFTETPWFGNYRVISDVNSALNEILDGMQIGKSGSTDTQRAIAFGKFCQGLAHGYLGLFFNKAFIYPEGVELQEYSPEFVYSGTVTRSAIYQLEECIRICDEYSFTLPPTWINGLTITNEDLKNICHSLIARYMVLDSRRYEVRAAVDWIAVLSHIEQGITEDFSPEGNGEEWWHPVQYSSNWKGWFTANNRLIGPSDTSDNYSNWLDTPSGNRRPFFISSPDRRITGDFSGMTDGKWFAWIYMLWESPIPPNYNSRYESTKFEYQYPDAYGPMPFLTVTEMDMLRAEAYLRGYGGTKTDAAQLINKTRVLNGEMEPLTGDESDIELWRWMCYEKRMETQLTGIAYFDYRSWAGMKVDGELVIHCPSGTMVEFPVPRKELNTLLMDDTYPFKGFVEIYWPWTTPSKKSSGMVLDSEYIRKARERINRYNRSKNAIPVRK
ncbi:hypothetical protein ACFL6O_00065 [candidate division KSB1 bacterium]